ncbi:MAG: iron-containing alcohol dehydrogenase [Alphaproteobacteria bacterium]|nr:iron-containing alcohol dehydrogenase [Alphaproteobacteria bacterium]
MVLDRHPGRGPCGRGPLRARRQRLDRRHEPAGAQASVALARGIEGGARRCGRPARKPARRLDVDGRRDGRGAGRRQPWHRPCARRRLRRAARLYLLHHAGPGAALEPAGGAERQQVVSEAMGQPDRPAADLVAELVSRLGLPSRLGDVGVGQDRFPEIAEQAMREPFVHANPRPVRSAGDILEILESAL